MPSLVGALAARRVGNHRVGPGCFCAGHRVPSCELVRELRQRGGCGSFSHHQMTAERASGTALGHIAPCRAADGLPPLRILPAPPALLVFWQRLMHHTVPGATSRAAGMGSMSALLMLGPTLDVVAVAC